MPSIFRKLEWLDKEDIIKRIVSLEFNRMIDYYKEADDIEVVDEKAPRTKEKRAKGEAEAGYTRFFINFGKMDDLKPSQLIELINRCVPGKVRVGRIDLHDTFSFFEVEEGEAQRVMDLMNDYEVAGRQISVEPAQARGESGKGSHGSSKGKREAPRKESRRGGRPGRGDAKPRGHKFYEDAPHRKRRK